MKTINLENIICHNAPYKLINNNLFHIEELCEGIIQKPSNIIIKPKSIIVKLTENNKLDLNCSENNNIFDKNNILVCENNKINIPIEYATKENLAYYNCQLINNFEIFKLESPIYKIPYFLMEIDDNYVKDYIMNKNEGGGVYLEYHDTPHFHFPTNEYCNGFITIGKKINDEYEITGFKIPYGTGIYTPPNTIHNDCFLTGKWKVVYTNTNNFYTGIIRTKDNELVEFIKS